MPSSRARLISHAGRLGEDHFADVVVKSSSSWMAERPRKPVPRALHAAGPSQKSKPRHSSGSRPLAQQLGVGVVHVALAVLAVRCAPGAGRGCS